MKKFKLIRYDTYTTPISGQRVKNGEIVEVSDQEGKYLRKLGCFADMAETIQETHNVKYKEPEVKKEKSEVIDSWDNKLILMSKKSVLETFIGISAVYVLYERVSDIVYAVPASFDKFKCLFPELKFISIDEVEEWEEKGYGVVNISSFMNKKYNVYDTLRQKLEKKSQYKLSYIPVLLRSFFATQQNNDFLEGLSKTGYVVISVDRIFSTTLVNHITERMKQLGKAVCLVGDVENIDTSNIDAHVCTHFPETDKVCLIEWAKAMIGPHDIYTHMGGVKETATLCVMDTIPEKGYRDIYGRFKMIKPSDNLYTDITQFIESNL